jgi:hypothetical protein
VRAATPEIYGLAMDLTLQDKALVREALDGILDGLLKRAGVVTLEYRRST